MSSRQIVVAHYNESLEWTTTIATEMLVYTKGCLPVVCPYPIGDQLFGCRESIQLPNVGREAHTYIHHIITHYDRLADWTFFTQAGLRDHLIASLSPLDFFAATEGVSMVVPRAVRLREWDEEGRLRIYGDWRKRLEFGAMRRARLSLVDWFAAYLDLDINTLGALTYAPGAIFSVRRDAIRSRGREFYQNLLGCVGDHVEPQESHYLERAWMYVFSPGDRVAVLTRERTAWEQEQGRIGEAEMAKEGVA